MMMNADQIRIAAQRWHAMRERAGQGRQPQLGGMERAGEGPYHLLAAVNAATGPFTVRKSLEFFPGVPVPNLCQHYDTVYTGQVSLHVVPQWVFDVIAWHSPDAFFMDPNLAIAPFAAPPTEADMADAFVLAMSTAGFPPGTTGLGLAVRTACDRMGWRPVVDMVNALCQEETSSPAVLVGALRALFAQPALVA